MNIHQNKSQSNAKEEQFNCEQCGKQFPKKMNLEKHISMIHDSPKMDHSEKQIVDSKECSEYQPPECAMFVIGFFNAL